jgi:hypothetical protein
VIFKAPGSRCVFDHRIEKPENGRKRNKFENRLKSESRRINFAKTALAAFQIKCSITGEKTVVPARSSSP